MAFSGPELSDYENVVSLNKAWLGLLQGDTRLSGGLAGRVTVESDNTLSRETRQ